MSLRIGILCEVITAVADAEKEALQVSWTTVSWPTLLCFGVSTLPMFIMIVTIHICSGVYFTESMVISYELN